MKNNFYIVMLFLLVILSTEGRAQNQGATKTDSVFSMAGKFKRSKIDLRTDKLVEYREVKGVRTKNAENKRTIEKVIISNRKYYKVTTTNIPAGSDNITTVVALLDYNDLHIIKMQLNSKTDSGYVEFVNKHFTGWSQIPSEERKAIDLIYDGLPLVTSDAGIQWIAGLYAMKENKKFSLSHFALFANVVKWRNYTVMNKENITIENRQYLCWKVNAGPMGPPGFTNYQWFESKSGRLIRTELSKEGSETKFVSELQF